MIKEIKKKRNKFGSVVSFVTSDAQLPDLLKHTAVSAFVVAHHVGGSDDKGFGQLIAGHRLVPKLKDVVGHYISQIRGGELVVFLKPGVTLLEDGSKVYDFLDNNRIERAYGLYLGPKDTPSAIILSGTLIEHLFHAIPYQIDMSGDWMGAINVFLQKSLFGGRYFDGNGLVALAEKVPVLEEPSKRDSARDKIKKTIKHNKIESTPGLIA